MDKNLEEKERIEYQRAGKIEFRGYWRNGYGDYTIYDAIFSGRPRYLIYYQEPTWLVFEGNISISDVWVGLVYEEALFNTLYKAKDYCIGKIYGKYYEK